MKSAGEIIKKMQLTEKSTRLHEAENKYFFEVAPAANKIEIRRAVEELFNVKVDCVNTMSYEGKRKRNRSQRMGRRPSWKRAIVTLKEGSSIEISR